MSLLLEVKRLAKPFAAPLVEEAMFQAQYSRSRLGRHLLARRQRAQFTRWQAAGKPDPPPDIVKHGIIRSYGQRFGLRTLVETGTFVGDTPAALQGDFDRILTIELSKRLYADAHRRFRHVSHVTVIHGDSSVVLVDLARSLTEPVLFWLDGHYSMGVTAKGREVSPILHETSTILDRDAPSDVVLIDDARLLGTDGYPHLDELRHLVLSRRKAWEFYVGNDIIRAHARAQPT